MSLTERWLLPEGMEDLLPPQAERLEGLRRRVVDLFHAWGYELVVPPMVDYLESLLSGTGSDLELQTFKLTDQLTGRSMGVRADMTPQVARIDAHHLKREAPARLCYLGTVLHTRSDGFGGSRIPYQIGAELYGYAGVAGDIEILNLTLEALRVTGIEGVHVDLGHVGIYRTLAEAAGLDGAREANLFDAMQRKALDEVAALLAQWSVPEQYAAMLSRLPELNGTPEIIQAAREGLTGAPAEVGKALDLLEEIASDLQRRLPGLDLFVDLAELSGYHYYTGPVFSAYLPGHGQAIASGGRYDNIGEHFGRARPATGFSIDLKTLILLNPQAPVAGRAIFAPAEGDAELETFIAELREVGERVVRELPGQSGEPREVGCNRILRREDGAWSVEDL